MLITISSLIFSGTGCTVIKKQRERERAREPKLEVIGGGKIRERNGEIEGKKRAQTIEPTCD